MTIQLNVTDDDTGSASFGVAMQTGTAAPDTMLVGNPASGINKVIVYGLAGDDTIDASAVTQVPVELIGGTGNDALTGEAQDDRLIGNNPGDYDLGAAGDTGNDTLLSEMPATTGSTADWATTRWRVERAMTPTAKFPAATIC